MNSKNGIWDNDLLNEGMGEGLQSCCTKDPAAHSEGLEEMITTCNLKWHSEVAIWNDIVK